jgi:hypothetical protein
VTWVRLALVLFVVAWLFDVLGLQAVPLWLAFVVALGLELEFFLAARQSRPAATPDRAPQDVDRDELGYGDEADELLLVREAGVEIWVPYSGESDEELDELIQRERGGEPVCTLCPVRGRPVARLATGVALIAALAAVAWFVDSRSGWNGVDDRARVAAEARFSEEASRIVGRPVEIRCDDAGEHVGAVQHADGVAEVGGTLAYLSPERCYALYRLAFGGHVNGSQTARAIAVLAHESWHLRGVGNEGRTECFALQSGVRLGERLGLSDETARRMMRQQLVENSLRGASSEEYRVPPGCREGGELDIDDGSTRFP